MSLAETGLGDPEDGSSDVVENDDADSGESDNVNEDSTLMERAARLARDYGYQNREKLVADSTIINNN